MYRCSILCDFLGIILFISISLTIYVEVLSCRVDRLYPHLNIEFVDERLGIFVMILLGESILGLVLTRIQDQHDIKEYITILSCNCD